MAGWCLDGNGVLQEQQSHRLQIQPKFCFLQRQDCVAPQVVQVWQAGVGAALTPERASVVRRHRHCHWP